MKPKILLTICTLFFLFCVYATENYTKTVSAKQLVNDSRFVAFVNSKVTLGIEYVSLSEVNKDKFKLSVASKDYTNIAKLLNFKTQNLLLNSLKNMGSDKSYLEQKYDLFSKNKSTSIAVKEALKELSKQKKLNFKITDEALYQQCLLDWFFADAACALFIADDMSNYYNCSLLALSACLLCCDVALLIPS